MKRINKILCLLFIIPLLAMCFVGCSTDSQITGQSMPQSIENSTQNESAQTSTTTIDLTSDNILDYLQIDCEIISFEIREKTRIEQVSTNVTRYYNTIIYNLRIHLTPKQTSSVFEESSFTFCPMQSSGYSPNYTSIELNKTGITDVSMIFAQEYLGISNLLTFNQKTYSITTVTGTVTIGE